MLTVLLLSLQSAAGPPAPGPEKLRAARPCRPEGGEAGDVVVCGRRNDEEFRLKPLPEHHRDDTVPRAEIGLPGGVRLATETEAAGVGGFQSNRVMLRLKLPF